jgi:hypothetical protein
MKNIIGHLQMKWEQLHNDGVVASTCTQQPEGDRVGSQRLRVAAIVHMSVDFENAMGGLKGPYKYVCLMQGSVHMWLIRNRVQMLAVFNWACKSSKSRRLHTTVQVKIFL